MTNVHAGVRDSGVRPTPCRCEVTNSRTMHAAFPMHRTRRISSGAANVAAADRFIDPPRETSVDGKQRADETKALGEVLTFLRAIGAHSTPTLAENKIRIKAGGDVEVEPRENRDADTYFFSLPAITCDLWNSCGNVHREKKEWLI